MKKYIILSVNDNVDYLYYIPLTVWAWKRIGWYPILFYKGEVGNSNNPLSLVLETCIISNKELLIDWVYRLKKIDEYRPDTITQVSRLYGTCAVEGYLMTGDADMVPLSDYWHPNQDNITVYGHDLTSYTHYPICYIGMDSMRWADVMNIKDNDYNKWIKRDLDTLPQAKSTDFYKYWSTDQDLITDRIKQYGLTNVEFINRGQYSNGYAKGRVDRGAWSLDYEQFIDCHMHRDIFKAFQNPNHESYDTFSKKWNDTMRMLEKCFPGENFDWFVSYTKEYAKLAQV